VSVLISVLIPAVGSPSSVWNGDYLDTLAEDAIDDEEGKRRSRKRLVLPT
jgi:hypothetical protein